MLFALLSLLFRAIRMDCSVSHTTRFPFFFSSWWSSRRSSHQVPVSVSTQTSPRVIAPPPPPSHSPPALPTPPSEPSLEIDREMSAKDAIEDLDHLVGLENVKRYIHGVQSWVQICRRHGRDPRNEWYNITFQGNPGTGKTTVARIYARLLYAMHITDSPVVKETTGTELASNGLASVLENGKPTDPCTRPSVLIIDHPYCMKPGQPALDDLMHTMEQDTNRTIVILTGDPDEMDNWLRQQPRLRRLTCSSIRFDDFDRDELLSLLARHISQEYQGRMQVEGGLEGQYMQVAARRLARGRARKGFLNMYAVREFLTAVARRQAEFLTEQQDQGMEEVDYLFFSKEDMLGLRPVEVKEQSEAWAALQKMVGQGPVKASVQEVVEMAEENYWREVQGQKRLAMRLNRVFAGPSGTGKTTAARLYAKILADLGLIRTSNVDVQPLADLDVRLITELSCDRVLLVNVDDGLQDVPQTVLDALTDRLLLPQEYGCAVLVGTEDAIDKLFSQARGRSKSAPLVVRFQGFTSEHIKELVEMKLVEQDVDATPEALQASMEILDHARLRKDFDHARAIDHLILAAHRNFTARQTTPIGQDGERILEAQDFSPELANVRSALSFRDELRHTIVPDDIISILKRYHTEMKAAWMMGQNPTGRVPSAFVFKGASGTGKKTVARQLGALYYRMGVLSSEMVVDCSISDLFPARGAREQFDRSRGQVLFVEDAHRLADTDLAPRALDELIYLIPRQDDQTVVILAGPAPEMDQLLANRPRLSSLFQEEIVFRNPTPRECLRLLDRRLEAQGIRGTRAYLTDPRVPSHREFTRAIQILSMFPCWGNAKEIEVLTRWMVSAVVRETPLDGDALAEMQLSEEQAMACLVKLYNLKRDRLRFNQDPKARTLPRVLSQPRCTDRTGVRFPV